MVTYNAGEASILISPNGRGFQSKVEAIVKGARAELGVDLNPRTGALERLRAQLRAQGLDVGVRVDSRQVEQFQARLRSSNPTMDVALRIAGAEATMARFRAQQQLQPIHQRVEVDNSSLAEARKRFGSLGLPGRGVVKIGVVVAAAEATVQLAGLAAEAAQAYKALSLLPAAGFAASAGLAGLIIGGNGVSAAFKAASAETAGSTSSLNSQAASARAARSAQRGLSDAYRQSSREIRDMNVDLDAQKESAESAALSVEEAAQRLNEVNSDPAASGTERKRADLDYRESLTRLQQQRNATADAAADTAQANAAGVQGSKEVLDALDAVASAQEQMASAAGGGGVDKTAEAMAKLAPSAREFVETARGLGPTWTEARKEIQQPLFEGTGPLLERLVDTQLPTLKTGLAGINTEINTGVRASLLYLTSDVAKMDFATSLKNTEIGFGGLARSAAPLTEAFTHLVTVGTSFLPQFGDAAENASRKFDNYITNASRTGQLRDTMQEGLTATKQLGEGIGNVGSIIASVFRAAGAEGNQLEGFVNTTGRWADSLKSISGQDTMVAFFSEARQDFAQWAPMLKDLVPLLSAVAEGAQLWGSILLPILGTAAEFLSEHAELVKIAIAAYLGFKTVGPILGTVAGGITAMSTATATSSAAAATGVGRIRTAGMGLAGMFNPYVAGAVAATAATVAVVSSLKEADQIQANIAERAKAVRRADEGQIEAFRTSGGAVNDDIRANETQRVEQWIKQQQQISNEGPSNWDRVVDTFSLGGAKADARESRKREADELTAALEKTGMTAEQVANGLSGTEDQYTKFFNTLGDGKPGMSDLQRSAADLRIELLNNQKAGVNRIADYYKELGTGAGGAADQVARLTGAIEAQRKNDDARGDARVKAAEAQRQLTQGITGANGELPSVAANGEIDVDTEQGTALYKNIQQLQSGRDAAVIATQLWAKQNKLSEQETRDEIQKTSDKYIQRAKDQLVAAGMPLPALDALFKAEKLASGVFPIEFRHNATQVRNELRPLVELQEKLKKPVDLKFLTQYKNGQLQGTDVGDGAKLGLPLDLLSAPGTGRADGGFLPTSGPGTDREDGIVAVNGAGVPIARVDGGEHVTKRTMSEKYSRELTMINNGTFPKLAQGGVIPGGVTPEESEKLGGGTINASIWGAVKAQFPDAVLSSGYRAGDPGYHGIKQAVDIGGPSMQRIADWIYGQKSQFAQLIWNAGPALYNVKKNQVGTGVATAEGAAARAIYGEATMAQHADHVHAAAEQPITGAATLPNGALANTGGTTTSTVLSPQAALPGVATDEQLSILSGQASVDSANSERNKIYADPASTAADKQAADIKYLQAQNSLQKTTESDGERFTLKGFFTKGAGILADGLLSGLGLENSILGSGNPYNQAITKIAERQGLNATGGYTYQPKNLPSVVTNYTPASTDTVGQTAPAAAAAGAHIYDPSGGVEQWRSTFAGVLQKINMPASLVDVGLQQMNTESGGNPKAQNNSDSNAAKGTPSKGLMQVIDPTFAAYKSSLFPNDIWNPESNIAAGTLYAKARYPGGPASVWGKGVGYDRGGIANGIGLMPKMTLLPERVLDPHQTQTYDSMLPLLENLNASAPTSVGRAVSDSMMPAQAAGPVTHDRSLNLHGPISVMNMDALFDEFERRQAMQTMGTR